MPPARPMLDDLELQHVQQIDVDENQVLAQHGVPALEGDFLQRLDRRATRVTLSGVLSGPEVRDGLEKLREKFRAAQPVPFAADIATATSLDQVLIEELGVSELAGKPERFAYALTLREFIPPPAPQQEPPPPPPPPPPNPTVGTLIVEVEVEGQPDFDFSTVKVTISGTQDDGTALSRTLTNRTNNIWTDENMPPGQYTAEAVVTGPPAMSGTATARVRAGQTTRVLITLRAGALIAKAFVVHYRFDSAFIEPCLRDVLRRAADHASAHPSEKLLIVGHTDLVGSDDYNQSLSERRARGVYGYMTFGRDAAARAAALADWNELRKRRPAGQVTLNDNWGTREYQYILQDLGFYIGNIDEDHGPKTDAAVRAFQAINGLPETGLVDDATWEKLVEAYLEQESLKIPESQLFKNARDDCDSGFVKWLGCGEKDPVKNTPDAWRPNRRTELLFVNDDAIHCDVPKPVTFDKPAPGAVNPTWCIGPDDGPDRHCFIARKAENQQAGQWLVQPAEPDKVIVSGTITFDDGTPVANAKYALIAPDGEFLHSTGGKADLGERPSGPQRGRPIPSRADDQGRFSHPDQKPVGMYIMELLELHDPQVARESDDPPHTARGNVVCFRLQGLPSAVRDAAGAGAPAGVKIQPAPVPPPTVNPILTPASKVVMVEKTYTSPRRVEILLQTSGPFTRTGILVRTGNTNAIKLFTAPVGGTEIKFNGTDDTFTGAALTAGVRLFAQSDTASGAVDDYQLRLELANGPTPIGPPATASLTAVALTLDIFQSRSVAGTDPAPLPQPPAAPPATPTDKWFGGRFVHLQDPGNHHGRALLIVRQVQPAAFTGTLLLRQIAVSGTTVTGLDTKVQLFDKEVQTAGDVAKPNQFDIPVGPALPAERRLFAQGQVVSGALRDTGFQLGIKGVEDDGDRVRMTVVRFTNLRADIPSTPAHTARLGNSPVARHALTRGAAAAITASDFDEDFAINQPLVLLEGAVVAGNPINLSVTVAPVGVPVSWSVQRDRRPAPNGDHANVIAASPRATPTITPNGANRLRATLISDAVGSFYIRPFVDCNGNNTFDHNIDREPFIIMSLVLVRATLHRDDSIARSVNFAVTSPALGAISVSSGSFNIAAPAGTAMHMNVQADIIGGGDDGTRGLNRVFAGWINNESANENIVGTFRDPGPPLVNRTSASVFASNRAAATGASLTGSAFIPADPAPVLVAPPLLDTGRGSPGTGGDTATLTRSRIRTRTNLRSGAAPAAVGQRLLIEAVDSPGDGEGATHPGFPAAQLIRFHFGLDFSAFMCFWTNITAVPGASGDPADRLYSVLRQVNWRMRGEWTVTPATGAITVVTAPTTTIAGSTTFNPLAQAVATPIEVRAPTGLSLLARNARS